MTMITPSYLGETIEYSSLHACRSTLEDPTDKTGLTGKYDALVRWMPDNMKPEDLANISPDLRPDDVSLFTALEEQLGLKLDAQKGPVDVLVVDSIDKPTEVARLIAP